MATCWSGVCWHLNNLGLKEEFFIVLVVHICIGHYSLWRGESLASSEIIERFEVLRLHFISELVWMRRLLLRLKFRLSTAWINLQINEFSIVHLNVMIAYPRNLRLCRLLENRYFRHRGLRRKVTKLSLLVLLLVVWRNLEAYIVDGFLHKENLVMSGRLLFFFNRSFLNWWVPLRQLKFD